MKKRVALCLAGHYRHWDACKENLVKNLIQANSSSCDFDIFFAMWDGSLGLKSAVGLGPECHRTHGFEQDLRLYPNMKMDLLETLHPKDHLFLDYDTFKAEFENRGSALVPFLDHSAHRPVANFSQLFCRKQAVELAMDFSVKNEVLYDLVIISRFDVEYKSPVVLVDSNAIMSVPTNDEHGGYSDIFFCGSPSAIKEYVGLYDTLEKVVQEETRTYSPHGVLKHFLDTRFHVGGVQRRPDWDIQIYGPRV